jgi:hypothetical protein
MGFKPSLTNVKYVYGTVDSDGTRFGRQLPVKSANFCFISDMNFRRGVPLGRLRLSPLNLE